ncbi:MAG: hypothetical protein JSV88_06580 [Candidatus Aminicenantes bacterium]|nr:MAG: hypothetical protein JSV88_06580 [Candidatus Aminicenantes bacterium]
MKLKKKLEESIDKLSNVGTDPDEFKIWLKRFLIRNISHPLTDYYLNEYPYEYLYRINEATSNIRFQERLRHAIKELFRDWNINAIKTETIEYYSNLLNLIAELPVTEMYPDLIEIALSGDYCGVILENEDIDVQTLILEVIVGMQVPGDEKIKDRLMDLVRKYIDDFRYTPLCFRIAWQIRYDNATQYINPLLACYNERKFDIYGTIERFLLGGGVPLFKNLLLPMLDHLQTNNMREDFLEILLEVRAEIRVLNFRFDFDNRLLIPERTLLLRWELYEQPVSQIEIPCDDDEIMDHIEKFNQLGPGNRKNKDEIFLERILKLDTQPSDSVVVEQ